MLKELWEKLKEQDRKPREFQYAKDADGKEVKFGITPPKGFSPSKHQASKKGYKHTENYKPEVAKRKPITNHQRVISARAKKQGITVSEYELRHTEEVY